MNIDISSTSGKQQGALLIIKKYVIVKSYPALCKNVIFFIAHVNLFIAHGNLFIAHVNLFIAHGNLFIAYANLFIAHGNLFIAYANLIIAHGNLFIAHASLCIAQVNLFIAHVNLEDHKKEVEMLFNKLHNNYDKRGKVTNLTPDYII